MASVGTPSTVMYARLKELGISNREAASLLLDTSLTFDGRTLHSRIQDSSQLSRRIVHTSPGEIPQGLFNDFSQSCRTIERRVLSRSTSVRQAYDSRRARASSKQARMNLTQKLVEDYASQMMQSLSAHGQDDAFYRDTCVYIERASLPHEEDRTLLHLMLFVVTGCLGDAQKASSLVVTYATEALGAEFHTDAAHVEERQIVSDAKPQLLGLIRVTDGHVSAGAKLHVLDPEGTQIGLLPVAEHIIADVDMDVSRKHARIWRADGRWYLCDLGSTNGTRLVSGADGSMRNVDPNMPVELLPSDVICLGATTRFVVLPVLGS